MIADGAFLERIKTITEIEKRDGRRRNSRGEEGGSGVLDTLDTQLLALKPDPACKIIKMVYCRIGGFIDEIDPTDQGRDRLKAECGLAARGLCNRSANRLSHRLAQYTDEGDTISMHTPLVSACVHDPGHTL
ncbi:hypothetical protein HZH68_002996 [Vespula germanica]|uniref:Uncharacterized protein n=1 Tax=Vespula germanica TaxID=30212 RepID=A0A834U2A4_VESGE|nr:hypothetical protein HZH68_002996 [Vespula germanica]